MNSGREIFFIRGLYDSPGTLVRPSRELLDSFQKILPNKFVFLEFIIVVRLRTKLKRYDPKTFSTSGLHSSRRTIVRLIRAFSSSLLERLISRLQVLVFMSLGSKDHHLRFATRGHNDIIFLRLFDDVVQRLLFIFG